MPEHLTNPDDGRPAPIPDSVPSSEYDNEASTSDIRRRDLILVLYALPPVISSVVWSGTILALLLLWAARDGAIRYQPTDATILYISDVGAHYKPLFIAGATVSAIFFLLSITIDRHLRRVGYLPPALRKREWWFAVLSIFFSFVGSICLILLTIFDDVNYDAAHWTLTLVFIIGLALSALFSCLEVWWLQKDYEQAGSPRKHLRVSQKIKLSVAAVGMVLTIAMIILMVSCGGVGSKHSATVNTSTSATSSATAPYPTCNGIQSTAAVLEWLIAFPLTAAYFASFLADVWPLVYRAKRSSRASAAAEGTGGVMGQVRRNDGSPGLVADRMWTQTRKGPGGVVAIGA